MVFGEPLSSWSRLSGNRWDAGTRVGVLRVPASRRRNRLGDFLARTAQGISSRRVFRGDASVRLLRSADILPVLHGRGTPGRVDRKQIQRHILLPGDVLMPRVGGDLRASYIGSSQPALVPTSETLVLRPLRQEWGAALAALLCTAAAGRYLHAATGAASSPTFTIDLLEAMLVPDLDSEEPQAVGQLVKEADALAQRGEYQLELVRQEVDLVLEGAPDEPHAGHTSWVEGRDVPQGWSWKVTCFLQVQTMAQRRCKQARLRPLADLLGAEPRRLPTARVASDVPVIENRLLRPDWHLAVPQEHVGQLASSAQEGPWPQGPLLQQLQEEALLVPLVGDVVAPPVVINKDLLAWAGGTVQVGLRWLPLTRFPYPRALAVVLDHPFLRLQRQLSATGSTVHHLAQEDIARVLVPAVDVPVWARWEEQVAEAHSVLFQAAQTANCAVQAAERWCGA